MEIQVSFSLIRICIAIWLFIAIWIDLSQYKRCLQMSPRINNCRWSIEKTKILDTDPEITYQLSLIKPNDFLKLFFALPFQSNTKKNMNDIWSFVYTGLLLGLLYCNHFQNYSNATALVHMQICTRYLKDQFY